MKLKHSANLYIILYAICILLHNFIWFSTNESNSLIVYSLKIIGLIFLLCLLIGNYKLNNEVYAYLLIFLMIVVLNLYSTIRNIEFVSFYIFSDLVGFFLLILYLLVGYNIGRIYTFEGIAKVINCFTLIMCLLFIIIAIFSDFEKISIPPDSHALIVFTSMYFIYHLKNKSKVLLAILILSIVGLGSFLSFHRITFLSFLFAFIAVYVIRNKFILFSMTSVLVYAFIDNYYIVADFFELVISQPDLVLDLSASQRIKESILIYNTLINKEIVLLGAGFGAFYYNTDLIQHYPEFVHQGHVSPMMLLFRNGVIGFLMYMILVFFSGYCVFDRSKKVFIFSSALLFSMFASLFDFYFYWGTHLGILIGLLIYYRKNEKTS